MYLRTIHAEFHLPTLRRLIRSHPLGVLTTAIPSPAQSFPLIQCSHIPWLLDINDESSETELGVLRGHMTRVNPQSKAMIEAATAQIEAQKNSGKEIPSGPTTLDTEVMVLFTSPVDHYVTPKFYTTTKPATGKVVPTWNYSAVQIYGTLKLYYDTSSASTSEFLSKQIADLSRYGEEEVMKDQEPWTVQHAPERYVDLLKKSIIGVEIEVKSMAGKWKMSQEMGEGDREGVAKGFDERVGGELGIEMAETVKERGELRKAKMEEERKARESAKS